MLCEALMRSRLVGLACRLVEAKFNYGYIRVDWREKVKKGGLREIQLDLVQGFKRVAKVDQNQVALVSEFRKQR